MMQTSIADCDITCDDNMFLDLTDFATIVNGSHDSRFLIGNLYESSIYFLIGSFNYDRCVQKIIKYIFMADVIGVILDVGDHDIVKVERKEITKIQFTLGDVK